MRSPRHLGPARAVLPIADVLDPASTPSGNANECDASEPLPARSCAETAGSITSPDTARRGSAPPSTLTSQTRSGQSWAARHNRVHSRSARALALLPPSARVGRSGQGVMPEAVGATVHNGVMQKRFKIGAYGLCRQDGRLLLARYVDPRSGERWWTLPGGKLEHGEDPVAAVRREVREETGYDVAVARLLGVGSRTHSVDWGIPGGVELHTVGVYYEVQIIGGELTSESNGSTDLAEWVLEADLPELNRSVVVDVAVDLADRRPNDGQPWPMPVGGPLRQ
jgi:8-oxo-dGTP diphosphatase